jgi:hypothetical protein
MATAAFAGSGIGAVFNLGKGNIVNHQSALSGSTNDQELRILNFNTGDHAAGLGISVAKGRPPLVISSEVKVKHLNVDKLDDLDSSKFQRAITGDCGVQAMTRVSATGDVSCAPSFFSPLNFTLSFGGSQTEGGLAGLQLEGDCHSPNTRLVFVNGSANAAELNWSFSNGGLTSTVNAGGVGLGASGGVATFNFDGARIEGQFVYAAVEGITTITVHALDSGVGGCEVRGTATTVLTS